MARWFGNIGFVYTLETSPGVYDEQKVEKPYYGDVMQDTKQWETGEGLNDNLTINNKISIVADEFAIRHFSAMRYAEYMGTKWKIHSATTQRPRIILSLGGEYNG